MQTLDGVTQHMGTIAVRDENTDAFLWRNMLLCSFTCSKYISQSILGFYTNPLMLAKSL